MNTIKVQAIAEEDGQVRLRDVPCRKGDRVEGFLVLPDSATPVDRSAARSRFLQDARASQFRSVAPYPTRDDLHERD